MSKYIVLFFLIAEILFSQTFLPGTINGVHSLSENGNPHIIDKELIINTNAKLIINPGVEIFVRDNKSIQVSGTIVAIGNKEKPIIIKEDNDRLSWRGFQFFQSSVSNVFNHVIIKNAEIYSTKSDLVFVNCSFINENKEIILPYFYIKDSKFSFDSCYVISNNTCNGIVIDVGKNIIVKNSYFENLPDAVEYMEVIDAVIENNIIINSIDDGIDLNGSENIIIRNNFINGAIDKGISIGNNHEKVSKNIIISNNVIINTNSAIAVKGNSDVTIINNTFHNNDYAVYCFEKTINEGGGFAIVTNSIFSDCKKNVFTDNSSSITISYSLSNTEELPGNNNLLNDPKFIDARNNNFRLLKKSPCIDAGDPNSELDPDSTIADIGAYYFNQSPKIVINEINYNSSPFFDAGDWLELFNNEDYDVDISNWIITNTYDSIAFIFPENTLMTSNSYFVICSDSIKFKTIFDAVKNLYCNFNFSLNDSGQAIKLISDKEQLIDFVEFNSYPPWDTLANGKGHSLELFNPNCDNTLAENWRSSLSLGTPGMLNENYKTDTIEQPKLAKNIHLEVIPNPIINVAEISITVKEESVATIMIYDNLGNQVELLYFGFLEKGNQSVLLNMTSYSSGIYFLKLVTEKYIYYHKIIHL